MRTHVRARAHRAVPSRCAHPALLLCGAAHAHVLTCGGPITALCAAVVCIVSMIALMLSPALYLRLRGILRPWLLRRIQAEEAWLVRLQRNQRPWLLRLHQYTSVVCSIEFYISFLPFLVWVGGGRLARQCVLLMGTSESLGDAWKDALCAPRPRCPPVRRQGDKELAQHSVEYGAPSTHTLNTVTLVFYLLWHFSVVSPVLRGWTLAVALPLGVAWAAWVAFGMRAPRAARACAA